jgi:hypothetical protein
MWCVCDGGDIGGGCFRYDVGESFWEGGTKAET